MDVDQHVEEHWCGSDSMRAHLLVQDLCTLSIASLAVRAKKHVVTHIICFNPCIGHSSKPLLHSCYISILHKRVHDGTVARNSRLDATCSHLVKPVHSSIYTAALRARMNQGVVADCIRLHAACSCLLEPQLRSTGVSSPGASINHRAMAHEVWLDACLAHGCKPLLGLLSFSSTCTGSNHGVEAHDIWLNAHLSHPSEPSCCPGDLTRLGTSTEHHVEGHNSWLPEVCSSYQLLQPPLCASDISCARASTDKRSIALSGWLLRSGTKRLHHSFCCHQISTIRGTEYLAR
mmetsp:Transcript_39305/g.85864  ORF Transcript_39305/g.85864 Transcript_39305/m.85864 type:complete len:290 (+) Transcript_39305:1524-2393(+)